MERPACHPGGWCGGGRREDRGTAFSQSRLQLLSVSLVLEPDRKCVSGRQPWGTHPPIPEPGDLLPAR